MFFKEKPLRAFLNRSIFPVDVISVRVTKKISNLSITQASPDGALKAYSGFGSSGYSLGPGAWFDIFLHAESNPTFEGSPFNHSFNIVAPPDQNTFFEIDWEQTGDNKHFGPVAFLWTSKDRLRSLAPFFAYGEQARELSQYITNSELPVTASLLAIRKRVPILSSGVIKARIHDERHLAMIGPSDEEKVLINSIEVEGFRGFRLNQILKLAKPNNQVGSGLTFVVGANNAGKSTIWESFDASARKMKNDVSFSEGKRNRLSPNGVHINLGRTDGTRFILQSRNADTSETKGRWEPSNPVARPEIVTVPSRRQFQANFSRGGSSGRDWMTNDHEFTRFRQNQNDRFTDRLFEVHNDDERKQKFDELMTEVLGYELQWTIELGEGNYGQSYYLKVANHDGVNHSSEGLGDGIISLLFVLNALYDSEPDTLLVLDEPELSLHPQLVRRLGKILARFAANRQIVILTHSPQLISWEYIAAGAEIARVYKSGADSRIAQPKRETLEDVTKLRRSWKNPHALGLDANEALFLDDNVIVVEGQEDAALLPKAFEQVEMTVPGAIYGWGSGGGNNISKIIRLLHDLEFKKVVALLDNNLPVESNQVRTAFPEYLVVELPTPDIRDKPEKGHEGIFDESGKKLKDKHKGQVKELFLSISEYLTK